MGADDGGQAGGWLFTPEFPDHWKREALYDLADWMNGLAFRKIQFSDSGKPVIKISEIKGGISDQTKYTQDTFDESVRVRSGDLLFSWSGQPETSIDAFWWRGPEGWLNQHIFKVTPKDGVDPTFFYYLLRYLNPNFVGIARNKQTTGLGHVTQRDLKNITGAYPDEDEQRAIAHILGTLDDKVELNRRMNQTLEGMARALFKSWFVDFDPVRAKMEGRWQPGETLPGLPAELYDLFPDRLVESELGEVPEGWEVSRIGDEVEAVGGGTPSTKNEEYWEAGDIHWATPKDLSGLSTPVLLDTARKITTAGLERISSGLLPRGTVLMSSRAPVGYLAIAEVHTAVNQGFIAMICNGGIGRHYVLRWAENTMPTIKRRAGGTTFAEISKRNFRPIRVLVPPHVVHDVWDETAAAIHSKMVSNCQELQTLAELRDTLLPRLISGDLRIEDAERILERTSA